MVAIAVSAPFEHKGGGTHGGVVVLVATVDAIIERFKGTPKAWSRYWSSPAFKHGSGDNYGRHALSISLVACLEARPIDPWGPPRWFPSFRTSVLLSGLQSICCGLAAVCPVGTSAS
jgi:hypothetical protein